MTKFEQPPTQSRSNPFLAQVLFYIGFTFPIGGLAGLIANGLEDGFLWIHPVVAVVFLIGGFFAIRMP